MSEYDYDEHDLVMIEEQEFYNKRREYLLRDRALDTYPRGRNHWNYDSTVRTFVHPDHGEFVGTQREFRDKYELSQSGTSSLVAMRIKHLHQWVYKQPIEEN